MTKNGLERLALSAMLAMAAILQIGTADAEIRTKVVEYTLGGTTFEGYLAYDDAVQGKRPGILVAHAWTGINAFIRTRTEMLARLGFLAFAPDVYGKGIRPPPPKESGAEMAKYMNNRPLLRERIRRGYDMLRDNPMANPSTLAAIGFCFGGTTVLELARSGAELAGTVVFHGELHTPTPADAKNIKSRILVLNGADDPYVPQEHIVAFQKEMNDAKADWQFVNYSGSVHSFTDPASGNNPARGAAYNERSDKRSWMAMQDFFREIFSSK